MHLLDLHQVSRSYGPTRALVELSVTVEPGTIGLVGNNGAGKSTLLKIILGMLQPDTGKGTVLGHDLWSLSRTIRGRIGYMPEAAAVVPLLKGVEYVALAGDLYGMPHRQAKRRAHEVLNYVGLGELRYRKLDEYSTGNLQRLKLAAALVHDPELLLLDEPTNGLDPAGRLAMLRLLEDLIRETGKSVILCTHLLGDVERLCQHVIVLHRGQVVRSGPLSSLKSVISGHYELACDGPAEVQVAFYGALAKLGAHVRRAQENGPVHLVHLGQGWQPLEFFKLAQQQGVVLTHLRQQEEDLESLFFRTTAADGVSSPQVSSDGNVRTAVGQTVPSAAPPSSEGATVHAG